MKSVLGNLGKPIIRVVLHGGLGNQLFQLFVAQAEALSRQSQELQLIPNELARYSTARGLEIENFLESLWPAIRMFVRPGDLLSRLRLPKIAKTLIGKEAMMRVPGYGTVLDGYFQELRFFQRYDVAVLGSVLKNWRKILVAQGLLAPAEFLQVTHIRLGDFFKSRVEAGQFAYERIATIDRVTDLVTDQEDIVGEILAEISLPFEVKLRPSADFSAWELFQALSRYKRIVTNGSSLAFWAAVLAGAEMETSNPEHVKIWRYLRSI